jgi:hypothetical protein
MTPESLFLLDGALRFINPVFILGLFIGAWMSFKN